MRNERRQSLVLQEQAPSELQGAATEVGIAKLKVPMQFSFEELSIKAAVKLYQISRLKTCSRDRRYSMMGVTTN